MKMDGIAFEASRKRAYVTPLPTTEDPEAEKASPEKNNPVWLLMKGFGQKLKKEQVEGPKRALRSVIECHRTVKCSIHIM